MSYKVDKSLCDQKTGEIRADIREMIDRIDYLIKMRENDVIELTKQRKSLEHHIARTDTLEEMIIPIYKERLMKLGVKNFFKRIAIIVSIMAGIITVISFI